MNLLSWVHTAKTWNNDPSFQNPLAHVLATTPCNLLLSACLDRTVDAGAMELQHRFTSSSFTSAWLQHAVPQDSCSSFSALLSNYVHQHKCPVPSNLKKRRLHIGLKRINSASCTHTQDQPPRHCSAEYQQHEDALTHHPVLVSITHGGLCWKCSSLPALPPCFLS